MASKQRYMRRLLDYKSHACTYEEAKAMVDSMQAHASTLPQHHQMNLRKVADACQDLITIAAGSVPASRATYAEPNTLLPPAFDGLDSPAGGMANSAPAGLGDADALGTLNQDVNPPAPTTTAATKHKSKTKHKQEDDTDVLTPAQDMAAKQTDDSKHAKQDGDKKRKRDEQPPEHEAAGKKIKKEKHTEPASQKGPVSQKDGEGKTDKGRGKVKVEEGAEDKKGKDGKQKSEKEGKEGKDKGGKSSVKKEQGSKDQAQQAVGDAAASVKKAKTQGMRH